MKAICKADMPVESQALKTSSKTEKKVPQGKKPRARSGLRKKQSSKHTFESKTEGSKFKTSQSDKETQSSSTKEKIPSHPSASTLVVAEMHNVSLEKLNKNVIGPKNVIVLLVNVSLVM
nr:hypothetical protein [Tanacetum cinerariifolium]